MWQQDEDNEGLVIVATVEHILCLNYPEDKVQVIVIADNCTDDTAEKLRSFLSQTSYMHRNVTVMERKGTGGKSGALNMGDAVFHKYFRRGCVSETFVEPGSLYLCV